MRTSTKVAIDKYVGVIVVFILKNIFRLFSFRREVKISEPKTIVVCKFLGMGSIIQSTPLLQTFKKQFPNTKIIYLSSATNLELLKLISVIDKSIIINDKNILSTFISSISCIRFLLLNRIDLFVDLEVYSHFSKIFTIFSDAKLKFGMTNNVLLKNDLYSVNFQLHTDRPVFESYLEMGKVIHSSEIIQALYPFQVEAGTIKSLCGKFNILGKYIVINPNASDLRIERRWPAGNFSKLIEKIIREFPGKQIVLIGVLSEIENVKSVLEGIDINLRKNVINTCGKLALKELIALIHDTELVITNDTGPMHLSFALNRPTIALFGPASPIQFGNHQNSTVVYKKVHCSPCVHQFIKPPCLGDNICMKQISVGEVFDGVISISKESR